MAAALYFIVYTPEAPEGCLNSVLDWGPSSCSLEPDPSQEQRKPNLCSASLRYPEISEIDLCCGEICFLWELCDEPPVWLQVMEAVQGKGVLTQPRVTEAKEVL